MPEPELPEPVLPLVLELDDGLPAAGDTQSRSSTTSTQAAVYAVTSHSMLVPNCNYYKAARARPRMIMLGAAIVTDLPPPRTMMKAPVSTCEIPACGGAAAVHVNASATGRCCRHIVRESEPSLLLTPYLRVGK